jgi:hypothetical protein
VKRTLLFVFLVALGGCGVFTDPATRIAFDIKAGVGRLGAEEGSSYTIRHTEPSKSGECTGPYKIQFDKVGALIIWCEDAAGRTISSHSTSYHAQFVDTPKTIIVDKPAGSVLLITIERRRGRAVITSVL